jgi:hypothetical protein
MAIGWTAIMALGWWMAGRRIALCSWESNYGHNIQDAGCLIRTTATRDDHLVVGLTVLLVLVVAAWIAPTIAKRRTAPAIAARTVTDVTQLLR